MSVRHPRARWAVVLLLSSVMGTAAAAQDSTSRARPAPAAAPVLPFSVHGFIQVYYRAGDPLIRDGFRLRKADLKFAGDVSPRLAWRVTFDAGKALGLNTRAVDIDDSTALRAAAVDQRSKLLQDAALTVFVNDHISLDIGQQVIPMTLEGTIPASKIETIERNLFTSERSRAIGLGDVRDIGVSANGLVLGAIEYHAGVFNELGESAGTLDPNRQKSVIGRVAIHPPAVPGLQVGATAGYQGGSPTVQRRRAGTEIQYRTPRFTLRAESMAARDGLLRRFGWYGLGVVRPASRVQFSLRYDSWDRDLAANNALANAFEHQVVVGGSYAFDPATHIVLNVVRQAFPHVESVPSGTFVLTAFQAAW